MELLQLKYFKAVAQTGKISEAAEALFVSAPALSTSIARLEKELGVQLFDRTNNRIILNNQGQIFLRYVNQIFSTLDYAKNELRQSMILQGQHVSVAFVATTQWTNLITTFSVEHPQFTLSCTSIKYSELSNSGLPVQHNFLFAPDDAIPGFLASELDSIEIFRDTPHVIMHKDHPLASRKSVRVSELVNETVLFPMQNYSLYEHLRTIFAAENLSIPASNSYSHSAGIKLAEQGFGIGFTYPHTFIESADLRHIPIDTPCPPYTFHLYWRKNHVLSQDELIFKKFVESYYNID